jgi:oligo-1,6-glucosidase
MVQTLFSNGDGSVTVHEPKWWKHGAVYQIYPSSYKDSNGDGVGDLPGIISKLDYLKDLGIDIIWLSPHYKSPQHDVGYDISDYKDIYEKYGTVADCDNLIKGAHDRGMKIIFDLVVNHTSDEHEWFQESRSSKTNPKRDWYIWRPAKYDDDGNRLPPNNWASFFGGPAWEWDEQTQEYYLHLFVKEQPDLNWENHETRKAVYQDAILHWLEKGVDGFRIDTISIYSKPHDLPDAPISDPGSKFQSPHEIVEDGPQLHEVIREMNKVGFSQFDTMTVGECSAGTYEEAEKYVSAARKEVNMVFQFDLFHLGRDMINHTVSDIPLSSIKKAVEKWQTFIIGRDSWVTSFMENHDGGRSVSRYASDSKEFWCASAKLLTVFLTTLSGTLFVYQGQEIGMVNVPKNWPIEEYKDVMSQQAYEIVKERSGADPKALKDVMRFLQKEGRDNCRTPMQWDSSAQGGFSTGEPWMKVNPSYVDINVKAQQWDLYSPLSFWKNMLAFRRDHKAATVYGVFTILDRDNDEVFSYIKSGEGKTLLVTLNFTPEIQKCSPQDLVDGTTTIILSSNENHKDGILRPYEAVVYEVL